MVLEIAKLVRGAPLHLHLRPRRQRLVQPHVTVHHHQERRRQSSLLQIDEHLAPVRGRLARRQPQCDENLLPILPDAKHGQHWSRHDALRHPDLQVKPVEEEHAVALGLQVPMVPALKELLQLTDNTGNCTLGEVLFTEQRFQRLADAPAVGAREVAAQNSGVDFLGATGVARKQLAFELARRAILRGDSASRDLELPRPSGRGDDAFLDAVTVAPSVIQPLVPLSTESGAQFFLQHVLYRFSKSHLEQPPDIKSELGNLPDLRGSLLHGVILLRRCTRRLLWSAEGYAISLFPRKSGQI